MATYIVSLQIKVSEIQRYTKALWCHNLPDAVFVRWIQIRKRGTCDGAIWWLNSPSTSILALFPIGMELVSDATLTPIATNCVDALVFTAVIIIQTFIHLLDESGGKASFVHWTIRHKFHVNMITTRPNIVGNFVATILSDQWAVWLEAVSNFQVIINTVVVILNLKRLKFERNLKTFRNRDTPHTVFVGPVIVRVVWTLQVALLGTDLPTAHHCRKRGKLAL